MKRLVATGAVIWARQNGARDREFLPEARQIAINYALVFGEWKHGGFVRVDKIESLPVAAIPPSGYRVPDKADTHAFLALRAPMLQTHQAQQWLTPQKDKGHTDFARKLLSQALRPIHISGPEGTPYLRFGPTPDPKEFIIASSGETFTLTCQVHPDTVQIIITCGDVETEINLSSTFAV